MYKHIDISKYEDGDTVGVKFTSISNTSGGNEILLIQVVISHLVTIYSCVGMFMHCDVHPLVHRSELNNVPRPGAL